MEEKKYYAIVDEWGWDTVAVCSSDSIGMAYKDYPLELCYTYKEITEEEFYKFLEG